MTYIFGPFSNAQSLGLHSEYLLIKNYMVVKSLYQFFYYHNKYLNSMKCREISIGSFIRIIQYTTTRLRDLG